MAHKVHPTIFRIGQTINWKSRWFNKKKYQEFLKQDVKLRDFIFKKLSKAGVDKVEIERTVNSINIIVYVAKPGLVIGRGGEGVEELKEEVKKIILKESVKPSRKIENKEKIEIKIQIEQLPPGEIQANVIAAVMAEQIEKRVPYRRVMKQALAKIMQSRGVMGAKVMVKGRLDGAEIARKEWLDQGKLPLQNLRADIDYATATAYTTYGTVGIKVWIYKGERFA